MQFRHDCRVLRTWHCHPPAEQEPGRREAADTVVLSTRRRHAPPSSGWLQDNCQPWLCRHVPDGSFFGFAAAAAGGKSTSCMLPASDSTEQKSPAALPVSVFVQRNGLSFLCPFRACRACPLPDKPHSRLRMPECSSYGKRAWSHGASRPSRLALSRQVPGNPCPRPARATRSWRLVPVRQARCAGTRNPLLRHASA